MHQTLRNLPLDMYVTDIKVRTPRVGNWVRIEKCQFSNRDNKMTAKILFNDLTVSGTVQLLDDTQTLKSSLHSIPREFCKMSLRLQRAGLGINAFPTKARSRRLDVRTEARFLDPKFLSVHAYGCKLNDIFKKRENSYGEEVQDGSVLNEEEEIMPDDKYREPKRERKNFMKYNFTRGGYEKDMSSYVKIENLARSLPPMDEQTESRAPENLARSLPPMDEDETEPQVRIITLNPDLRTNDDTKWFSLHEEQETDLNDFHRQRLIGSGRHRMSERDKLKAVLHVQNLIAQQANHVFQTQGPFSQNQKPPFKPFKQFNGKPLRGPSVVSTITELDENLSPIRPIPQRPFDTFFAQSGQIITQPNPPYYQNYYEVISREMEDIFLRGIKTLLTRYVEKQLEIPLKEALMVNIGYTVSYG